MTVVRTNAEQRKQMQPMHRNTVRTPREAELERAQHAFDWFEWEQRNRSKRFNDQRIAHANRTLESITGNDVLSTLNWSDDLVTAAAAMHVWEQCVSYAQRIVLGRDANTRLELVYAMREAADSEMRSAAGRCRQSGMRMLTDHAVTRAWTQLFEEVRSECRSLDRYL